MKEFQIRAKDGSKSTDETFSAMSKSTFDLWESFNRGEASVAEVASAVTKELQGMDDQVTANQLAVALFGTKWEDLESTAMYAMLGSTDAMESFEGAMETVNQIQFSSFNAAIRGIGRILFMDLVYPIGDAVLPYLNIFAQYLKDRLPNAISRLKMVLTVIGPIVLGLVGAFAAYKVGLSAVVAYQKIYNGIQKASTALMAAHRTAMLASTFAGGGFKGMLAAASSGMRAFNAALLANPVMLIVAGLTALGTGLYLAYQKSETFRNAVTPLLALLKETFMTGVSQIGATVMSFLPQIMEAFSSLGDAIMSIATAAIPILSTIIQSVFPIIVSVIQSAVPLIATLIQGIAMIFTNVAVPAIQAILTVVQYVFPYVQMIIQNALAIVNGLIQAGMALLRGDWDGAWNAILSTASTIMNNIISFFQGINLYDVGIAIINGLINGIKSMGGAVLGAIGDLVPKPLKSAASKFLGALPGFAEGGIVGNPTLAWIGEGGDTESIIPWNNSDRSKDLWLQTGQALGMLNNDGMLADLQKQTAPDASIIDPKQVANTNNGGGIVLHYAPQYSVQRPEDLDQVKQYADTDKDDLEARLNGIKRDERRRSFGD